jgi:hypothetical protein
MVSEGGKIGWRLQQIRPHVYKAVGYLDLVIINNRVFSSIFSQHTYKRYILRILYLGILDDFTENTCSFMYLETKTYAE